MLQLSKVPKKPSLFVVEKLVIKRWINTRDQWVKRRREDRAALKSGAGPSPAKKYVYYDQLLFLERVPSRRKRATQTNTETTKGDTSTETTKRVTNTETTKGVTNTATIKRFTNTEGAEDFAEESAINEHLDANEPTESGLLFGHPKQKTSRTRTKRRRGLDELEPNTIKAPEGGLTTENRHLMFFKGILPYLTSFTDTQAFDFQMGVLQVIKNITTVNQTPSIQPNKVFGVDRHILHPPQFPKTPIQYPHPSSLYLQLPTPSSPLRQRRKSHKLEQFRFISVLEDMKDQLSVKKEPEVDYDDCERLSSNEIDDPNDDTDL